VLIAGLDALIFSVSMEDAAAGCFTLKGSQDNFQKKAWQQKSLLIESPIASNWGKS
jgi:hypothetical protein